VILRTSKSRSHARIWFARAMQSSKGRGIRLASRHLPGHGGTAVNRELLYQSAKGISPFGKASIEYGAIQCSEVTAYH
jgi:hypothetical protein